MGKQKEGMKKPQEPKTEIYVNHDRPHIIPSPYSFDPPVTRLQMFDVVRNPHFNLYLRVKGKYGREAYDEDLQQAGEFFYEIKDGFTDESYFMDDLPANFNPNNYEALREKWKDPSNKKSQKKN
eukprot:TRINITY_DN8792_c0_g1_i1.p1 TRINITY_DN8792_c0_g1~~TRINITY_DN8792_c0_g1_i1.p1  ORF type:complete len:124 (-),score=48.34 TRINITY_DN8792_c0_g1_i1:59-430(-)